MSEQITKSRKKNYWVFNLSGNVDMEFCIKLKEVLMNPIESEKYNICLDMTEATGLHKNGLRLIKNIQKNLETSDRKLAIFGAQGDVLEILNSAKFNEQVPIYKDIYDFENSFTKDYQDAKEKFYQLGLGKGPLRQLNLKCPLCEAEGLTGYLWDDSHYEYVWEEKEITPQWRLKEDRENEVDVELYEVAVCPKCYFASRNLSHFVVCFPEGVINSTLDQEERERLVKKSAALNTIMTEFKSTDLVSFFSVPRKRQAAMLSWQLYEKTVRHLSEEKSDLEILEIARSSILSAKFVDSKEARTKFLSTAHVWLTDLVNNPDGHLTIELVTANIYLMSVSLAMNKEKDAQNIFSNFISQFGEEEYYEFWVQRAHELLKSEDDELE